MATTEMNHRLTLVVGDWSGDGHSKSRTVDVVSNLPKEGIQKAYAKGVKVVGIDLTKHVCRAYEDNLLPKETLNKFIAAGFDANEWGLTEENAGEIYLEDEEQFADLWLFIAQRGDEGLRVQVVADHPRINIGGYGLFCS